MQSSLQIDAETWRRGLVCDGPVFFIPLRHHRVTHCHQRQKLTNLWRRGLKIESLFVANMMEKMLSSLSYILEADFFKQVVNQDLLWQIW